MPGVQVKWSADARDALREVDRRLPAPARQGARREVRALAKIPVITCQLALPMIEETVGRDKLGAGWDTLLAKTKFEPATAPRSPTGRRTVSPFTWTEDAIARLNRVPAGLHARHDARGNREGRARQAGVTTIDLAVCEEGIGHARETMNEVIAGYIKSEPQS